MPAASPPAREGLCQTGIQRMERKLCQGADLATPYAEAARATARRRSSADPGRADVHAKLANIHRYWANHSSCCRQEPFAALDLAGGARAHAPSRLDSGTAGLGQPRRGLPAARRVRAGPRPGRQGFAGPGARGAAQGRRAEAAILVPATTWATRSSRGPSGGDGRRPAPRPGEAAAPLRQGPRTQVPDFGYAHANRGLALVDRARYELGAWPRSFREPEGALALARPAAARLLPKAEGIYP